MSERLGWVDVQQRGEVRIARVHGEVDISNADEVLKVLEGGPHERAQLHIVDLSETRYFDSSGIRALFSLASRLQSRRQGLHVIAPEGGAVKRLLELADLQSLVPVHDSIESVPQG